MFFPPHTQSSKTFLEFSVGEILIPTDSMAFFQLDQLQDWAHFVQDTR
jgi:hypothetical protein